MKPRVKWSSVFGDHRHVRIFVHPVMEIIFSSLSCPIYHLLQIGLDLLLDTLYSWFDSYDACLDRSLHPSALLDNMLLDRLIDAEINDVVMNMHHTRNLMGWGHIYIFCHFCDSVMLKKKCIERTTYVSLDLGQYCAKRTVCV